MSYQRQIRELVARKAHISPDQVFITVEKANKWVFINWQESMHIQPRHREIAAEAKALLPANLHGYGVSIT